MIESLASDFVSEARELLEQAGQGLLVLERSPEDTDRLRDVFRALHTLKGAAGAMGLEAPVQVLHTMEGMLALARDGSRKLDHADIDRLLEALDQLDVWVEGFAQDGQLPSSASGNAAALVKRLAEEPAPRAPYPPVAVPKAGPPAADPVSLLIDAQRDLLDAAVIPELHEGRLASVATVLERLGQAGALELSADVVAAALDLARRDGSAAPLRALLEAGRPVPGEGTPAPIAASTSLPTASTSLPTASPGTDEHRKARSLRIDPERIDRLVDLAGELVVAKNALPFLARRAERDHAQPALAREIKGHYSVLHRLVEELQQELMRVRLVPVGTAFLRLPRVVRDLSQQLGRQVDLLVEGEEVEVDKDVAEMLAEPLLHLVRNAIDHGIEVPEARRQAGKDPTGRLSLKVTGLEDQVIVEVVDDGRGIDTAALRRQAVESGQLTAEAVARLDESQAAELVFLPGLSTAAAVSEVSGRGVGMDAVRTAVLRRGGSISIESRPGQGTRVQITLARSMNVTRVMVVEAAGDRFGLPIESVIETFRLPGDRLHRVKGRPVIDLRGRLLPLHRLSALLGLASPPDSLQELADAPTLAIRTSGGDLGLVVDRLHEGVDLIVKPLEGVLAGHPSYAGSALLGDGRVLLILDLRALVARVGEGLMTP